MSSKKSMAYKARPFGAYFEVTLEWQQARPEGAYLLSHNISQTILRE